MELTLIPNEQTPAIPDMEGQWIVNPRNIKIMYEFVQYVTHNPRALGMAANQMAANGERIMLPFFMMRRRTQKWAFVINPKITNYHGKPKDEVEICLTWEGKKVLAKRHNEITVEWHKMGSGDGMVKIEEKLVGLEAQIFQHEYDHLMGTPEVIVDWNYLTVKGSGKIGRNDACPCGSGQKFKKCCRI